MPARKFSSSLRAIIEDNLRRFSALSIDRPGLTRAAVSAVIVPDETEAACFVLTLRASRMGRHAGQWALPGGRLDAGESPQTAALRELGEEVSLSVDESAVLGILDDYETRSGFVITPVVVWADVRKAFTLAPREVAAAFRVPLAAPGAAGGPEALEHPRKPA